MLRTDPEPKNDRMSRDNIFQHIDKKSDFTFNDQVAEVFDDMVHRSVPLYETVIDAIVRLLNHHFTDDLTVYDLGCSTGTTLIELAKRLDQRPLQLIGIDNAPPMLEKARRKAAMFRKTDCLRFIRDDITSCPLPDVDAVICNYTLQFIRPPLRRMMAERLYQALRPGGILIICEKVLAAGSFHHPFIDIYHDFKREQGYSELEIAGKREALENVLIPFTVDENLTLLRNAGFSQVEIFCKWFNFAAFVALKEK